MYRNRVIYSSKIRIIDKNIDISVVSCVASNRSLLLRFNTENDIALESRIKFVLDIFGINNCGVFKQDTSSIAKNFKSQLLNRNFK